MARVFFKATEDALHNITKQFERKRPKQVAAEPCLQDSAVRLFPYIFLVSDCQVPGHQFSQFLMGREFAQVRQHAQYQKQVIGFSQLWAMQRRESLKTNFS